MSERKPISQKLRFEIFKRDNFTCQYCGRKAPNVVLEVDHIKPVAEGGKNTITNLITSCFDCNRGKGKRTLNNLVEMELKQEQLEILNEKRKQIKMIAKWEEELLNLEEEQVDIVENIVKKYGAKFSVPCRVRCKQAIKQFGLQEIIDCTNISFSQYYNHNDESSINIAINYIFRVAQSRYNQQKYPYMKEVNYLMKMVREKHPKLGKKDYYEVKDVFEEVLCMHQKAPFYDEVFGELKSIIVDNVDNYEFYKRVLRCLGRA